MCESLSYRDDPSKYCSRINTLLEQNSHEWQTMWKALIPELCNLPPNESKVINFLLKPIENAFKKKHKLRAQAFECWCHFVVHCDRVNAAEKLWTLLLVPLVACNHSEYEVLSAKLKTWDTFIDTSFHTKPNIMRKAIPALLKCLYRPHKSDPACSFPLLSETCGQLYLKMMKKCSTFNSEICDILGYLEKAIPPLSNMENTQKLAKLIWNEALKVISESGWQTEHFKYLMRTLKNLCSDDNKNDGFQLISNFLTILFDIHGSFPPNHLTPHMNLVIRCLFHPSVNIKVVGKILNSMLKRCDNPAFCFHELDKVLIDRTTEDKTDVDLLWIEIASCYTKWIQNNGINKKEPDQEYTSALKILLFPYRHFSEISYDTERFNAVMTHWKSCYEQCVQSARNEKVAGSETLMRILLGQVETGIDTNIPRLIVATFICHDILKLVKFSDGFVHMKSLLIKIFENMPDKKTLTDSKLKPFAIKYIITVQAYRQLQKSCSEDFSHVMNTFSLLLPKDAEEVFLKTEEANEGNNGNKLSTPTSKRATGFLERLVSSVTKKLDVESPTRLQTTPKASKIDDDDIQIIEVKQKPKNSPMTQHQLEKAKSKRYIPALYQDLSQSHSQSVSQSESESLFLENKKPNISINPDVFEENANLPSIAGLAPKIPRSLSFHTGLNSPFTEKKSTFDDNKKKSRENSDSDSSIEVISENKTHAGAAVNNSEMLDKQTTKRKTSERFGDVTPVKKSKRLLDRVENNADGRSCRKSRKSTNTPVSAGKSTEKSSMETDRSTNGSADESEMFHRVVCRVSSPLNSPMNLQDGNPKSNEKRKSLRARGNSTPRRSPIPLRIRRPVAVESDSKKSTDSDDSISDRKSARDSEDLRKKKIADLQPVHVLINNICPTRSADNSCLERVFHEYPSLDVNVEKETAVIEKSDSSVVVTPLNKSSLSDSVILIEDGVNEVISIEDSECVNAGKKPIDSEMIPSTFDAVSVSGPNSSDESTFYEGSDQNAPAKQQPNGVSTGENSAKENISTVVQRTTNSNSSEVQKLPISPEVISSVDSNCTKENDNILNICTDQRTVETSAIEDDPISSVSSLENSRTSAPDQSVNNEQLSSKKDTANNETMVTDATLSNDNKSTAETPKDHVNIANKETSLSLENGDQEFKSLEENNDKRERKDNCDSISSIHGNSRGSQLTKLAQGSNYVINKPPKSPRTTSPKPDRSIHATAKALATSGNYPSPLSSRAMKILSENKPTQSTPTKCITPLQGEKRVFAYTLKECTSPGILKKPDANQNTSPKSPKVVNFADQLTHVKFFDEDDDSLISTGDIQSNENLLNNEKLRSQDMLYSPLHNCKDDVRPVLEYIFSSAGSEQAFEYFQGIGITTVGRLASMSTLTANSIPAGDNRIRRMRRALKKYESEIENRGRRLPSARRRLLKSSEEFENRDITCLENLFDAAEPADESMSDEETETPSEAGNNEPSEETDTNEGVAVSEEIAPNVASNDTNIPPAVLESSKDKTENDNVRRTKDNEEPSITSSNELEEPSSKPTEPEMLIIDDSSIESIKSAEKEPAKEAENKENVDPRSDVMNADLVPGSNNISNRELESEPMEVDEEPCANPKTTNETINESADYVCTDSTAHEQDVNDKRSVTMSNIRRYSTVIEPNGKEKEVPSDTSVSTEPTTSTEKVDLQETAIESQETYLSDGEGVIAMQIEQNEKSKNQKNIEQINAQSVMDLNEAEFPAEVWVDIVKQNFPYCEDDEEICRKMVLHLLKNVSSVTSTVGYKIQFAEIEKK